MVGTWVDAVKLPSAEGDESEMGGLVEFLKRFDVVSSEEAEKALLSVFAGNMESFQTLTFNGSCFLFLWCDCVAGADDLT